MTDSKSRVLLYINESLRDQNLPTYSEIVLTLAELVTQVWRVGNIDSGLNITVENARNVLHAYNQGMRKP